MTCKDCVHYDVCKIWCGEANIPMSTDCDYFKNKADVVEIVRCKDCCYANDHASICHYGVGREVTPDHYCGYGEKR